MKPLKEEVFITVAEEVHGSVYFYVKACSINNSMLVWRGIWNPVRALFMNMLENMRDSFFISLR